MILIGFQSGFSKGIVCLKIPLQLGNVIELIQILALLIYDVSMFACCARMESFYVAFVHCILIEKCARMYSASRSSCHSYSF